MKYAQGYTRLGWPVASLALLVAFVFLLCRALQALPVDTACAVWTGIGAVGTVLMGALLFDETLNRCAAAASCSCWRHRRAQARGGLTSRRPVADLYQTLV